YTAVIGHRNTNVAKPVTAGREIHLVAGNSFRWMVFFCTGFYCRRAEFPPVKAVVRVNNQAGVRA
ncbi:hypothetical protein QUH49_22410, partial [Klebsiella pneumoniae]|uniref:hypothetical protein n=1 Tax=Enterobacteriaceae TaxID=543 RepID=UPI0025A231A4